MKLKDMKGKIDEVNIDMKDSTDNFKTHFVSVYACSFPQNDEEVGDININTTNYGWICPRCEKVYSPDIKECWRCNNKDEETITSTSTDEKYSKYSNMY